VEAEEEPAAQKKSPKRNATRKTPTEKKPEKEKKLTEFLEEWEEKFENAEQKCLAEKVFPPSLLPLFPSFPSPFQNFLCDLWRESKAEIPGEEVFGTKISHVVACVDEIINQNPNAKILIFSNWPETLVLLGVFLRSRKIKFCAVQNQSGLKISGTAGRANSQIDAFREDPSIKVLLLNVRPFSLLFPLLGPFFFTFLFLVTLFPFSSFHPLSLSFFPHPLLILYFLIPPFLISSYYSYPSSFIPSSFMSLPHPPFPLHPLAPDHKPGIETVHGADPDSG
jgi:hypothetical protein